MLSDRPEHPAMDAILQAIENIETAELLLKESKESLQTTLANLPSLIGDNTDLRNNFIWYIYWKVERVQQAWIKKAFGLKDADYKAIITQAFATLPCPLCQQKHGVRVRSRLDLRQMNEKWWRDQYATCDPCREAESKRKEQEYQEWSAANQARYEELRTMPYREYLDSPEWQGRRKRAMKRAGFGCQVCNAHGVRLNVHHRTYERRGNEDDRDLIVLCQECHAIFHENGSLANVEEG